MSYIINDYLKAQQIKDYLKNILSSTRLKALLILREFSNITRRVNPTRIHTIT